jgi:cysteine desulfurase
LNFHKDPGMRRINFDHQAGSPLSPEVVEAMTPWLRDSSSRPTALHHFGLQAKQAMARARESLASLVGAKEEREIVFTASAVESTNLALKGYALANRSRGGHIVACETDSPAVLESLDALSFLGIQRTLVKPDAQGRIDPAGLANAIQPETLLIATHAAHPDLGAIQNLAEIGRLASEHGIPLFVEAEAAMGWVDVDVGRLGIKLLSFSPNVFHGPKGCGVLFKDRRIRLEPLIHGGDQEFGCRAGEENLPALVGAGMACERAMERMADWRLQAAKVQEALWNRLQSEATLIRLHGPPPGPGRLANHLNFSMEFVEGEGLALFLDMKGIAVHTGAACTTRSMRVAPAFQAIGVPPELAKSNLLLTWSAERTIEEAGQLVDWILKGIERMRGLSPSWEDFREGRIASVIADSGKKVSASPG